MEKEMDYVLRSRDQPLIEFSLYSVMVTIDDISEKEYQIQITKIHNENRALFPKNLVEPVTDQSLSAWIHARKVPKNRAFVSSILKSISDSGNPMRYADVTYALSVNDAYWITPEMMELRWKDCNLYDHPFDERLSQIAFTGFSRKVTGVITTPETTAGGALKKCWKRRGNEIYLMKGDPYPFETHRNEAVLEYYAAQVADVMGFDHVDYDLAWYRHSDGKREVVCTCDLFTSEKEGYVDAASYFASIGLDVLHMDLTSRLNEVRLAEIYGKEAYADMMVFDSLIFNIDRHLGNFGYLVNTDTGEYIRPAPLFDNGRSFFFAEDCSREGLDELVRNSQIEPYMMNFDQAARLFVKRRHLAGLRRLTDFNFRRHPSCQVISEEQMKKMDLFIQKRAGRIIEIFHEREKQKEKIRSRGIER